MKTNSETHKAIKPIKAWAVIYKGLPEDCEMPYADGRYFIAPTERFAKDLPVLPKFNPKVHKIIQVVITPLSPKGKKK